MPRSQFGSPQRRPSVFRDRADELRLIAHHAEALRDDPGYLRVVQVVGLGGVGKTRLLNELRQQILETDEVGYLVWASLEAEASATETAPLMAIRDQLDIECLLFDTALLTYWSATGQPFQREPGSPSSRSVATKAVEVSGGVAGVPLPLGFAMDVYRSLARRATRRRHYRKEEFAEIDELRLHPAAIRARLPHYLGIDIHRRLEFSRQALVVFYDGYEKQAHPTLAAESPWLREFIGTLDRGLHVISTREPLHWDEADWGDVLEPVLVSDLPESDAREMIRAQLGELDAEFEERLLVASRRIPFFLEAAIHAYAIQSKGTTPFTVSDLPGSPDEAVSYLLRHLPEEERMLAAALASVQIIDFGLYSHLVRALNLPVSVLEFDKFVELFFVEEIGTGLHKTHDLLTDFVRASAATERTRLAALEAATEYLLIRCRIDALSTPTSILPLLGSVIEGWYSVKGIPTRSAETIIDAGYVLYDAGYWNELSSSARVPSGSGDHPMAVVSALFAALAARRTEGVDVALSLFDHIEDGGGVLGRHQRSVDLEIAYLSEISGNYSRAREEFRQLDSTAVPFDPTDRAHVRSRLYHADMLQMDGRFKEASRLLLESYELVGEGRPLDWAEFVRHRGHTFRFCFLLEQAEDLYLRALRAAAEAPALTGKIYTNLAETYCWHDPSRAMSAAAVSTEINLRLGNQIELAKCEAARAIALGRLGESYAAKDAVDRARSLARAVGYPAGAVFAGHARAVLSGLSGDTEALLAEVVTLRESLVRLGTYGHLLTAPTYLTGDEAVWAEVATKVDWLERETLDSRLRSLLAR